MKTSYLHGRARAELEAEFRRLCAADARLAQLEAAVRAHGRSGRRQARYCANAAWYGEGRQEGFRGRLARLVGYDRRPDPHPRHERGIRRGLRLAVHDAAELQTRGGVRLMDFSNSEFPGPREANRLLVAAVLGRDPEGVADEEIGLLLGWAQEVVVSHTLLQGALRGLLEVCVQGKDPGDWSWKPADGEYETRFKKMVAVLDSKVQEKTRT